MSAQPSPGAAPKISEEEEARRGQLIAAVLGLKPRFPDNACRATYTTTWGDKTALGLYRTLLRLVLDGE